MIFGENGPRSGSKHRTRGFRGIDPIQPPQTVRLPVRTAIAGLCAWRAGQTIGKEQEFQVTIGSGSDAAPGYVEQAGATVKVRCPHCGDDHPRRLERKGFLQLRVYPLFGYYPWLCGACKATFLKRKRYRRKTKKKDYVE
jgi:hypothetical protein